MSDHALEAMPATAQSARRPSWGAAAWRQYRLERRMFWRNPTAAFFGFLLPLLLLAMFGAVFSGEQEQLDVVVPGIAANAVANTVVQVAVVLVAGRLFFGIAWPGDWFALLVFLALGVVCFASLGVALSHAIPNFDSAPAYVNAVFLPVIFISGVFYDADNAVALLVIGLWAGAGIVLAVRGFSWDARRD